MKKPHDSDAGPGDVDHLLPEYEKLLVLIEDIYDALKAQRMAAFTR